MASNFLFLYFVLSWKNSSVIGHFSVDSHLKRSLFNSQTWLTVCFGSVQFSCSVVFGSAISWSTALQASLSITNSQRLLKLMSTESVIPSNHLILCSPLFFLPFPASVSFLMSQFFSSGCQSSGAPASASVLPMNIQSWFPLGWTGLISLQSKGLSRVFSNTTVQKHQFFSAQLSL